jgi:hypothetical protein
MGSWVIQALDRCTIFRRVNYVIVGYALPPPSAANGLCVTGHGVMGALRVKTIGY